MPKTYVYMLTSTFLFSTVFIFSQQIIPPLSTYSYLFLRSLLGAIFLIIYIFIAKLYSSLKQALKDHWKDLLVISILFHMVPLLIVFFATGFTSAANQIIINNMNLSFVVLINLFVYKKKPTSMLIVAVILNFVGVLLVLFPLDFKENSTLLGDIIMIIGVFVGAFFPAWNKRVANKTDPIVLGFFLNFFPAIFLLPFMFFVGQAESIFQLDMIGWFYILWIGIGISAIGYCVGNAAYKDKALTPEIYATVTTLMPVIGLILSLVVFGEQITWINFIGAIIVISSIYIATRVRGIQKKENERENIDKVRNKVGEPVI